MGKILLEGIRLNIRVGTTEQERNTPQPCQLDLSLETDFEHAGCTGDLAGTVDYSTVFQNIEKLCSENSFVLLEQIGHKICDEIHAKFAVERMKVKIRKLHPFSDKLSSVGIEMKSDRKQQKKNRARD